MDNLDGKEASEQNDPSWHFKQHKGPIEVWQDFAQKALKDIAKAGERPLRHPRLASWQLNGG